MTTETDAAVKTEPWFFVREGCVVMNGAGHIIAKVSITRVDEVGLMKRGHLAAASPELLEALKLACEEIKQLRRDANNHGGMIDEEDFVEGLAAIAKAEGRSHD